MARYLIIAFYVNSKWNGQFLGPFLELREGKHEASRNVATSQRLDVESTQIEVNKWKTSRRQREFCVTIIKRKKGDQKSRHQRTYE